MRISLDFVLLRRLGSALACLAPIAAQCATVWSPLGSGVNAAVYSLATLPNGYVVAGGSFTTAGAAPAQYIARWDGMTWSRLGSGMNSGVLAMTVLPNGDVVAGGSFFVAGGVAANHIARWDGTAWSPLGAGYADVWAVTALSNGDIVAGGGYFDPMRWDGVQWSPLPGINVSNGVLTHLITLPDGDVVAGGSFQVASVTCSLARWDGVSWSAVGPTGPGQWMGHVTALATLPNGDLLAAFDYYGSGGVRRWNGATWAILGIANAAVFALAVLPNGDVIASGAFTIVNGVAANSIARWNGSAWSAMGVGGAGGAYAMAMTPAGELVLGGNFATAGGLPAFNVARLIPTCPAAAVAHGLGCPSSGGANTLAASTLPWLGSVFRTRGSGLPTTAAVFVSTGTATLPPATLPLTSIFSQGVPGCDVLVAPDILGLLVTTNGVAESLLSLPNTPAVAGAAFYQQMIPVELGASGNPIAVTATNALHLTAGVF